MHRRSALTLFLGFSILSLSPLACLYGDPDAWISEAQGGVTMADFHEPTSEGLTEVDPACVEPGRYLVTDELVADASYGDRIWQRRVPSHYMTLREAKEYCASLELEGLSGFRLPSVYELNSLKYKAAGIDGGRNSCVPSIDALAFPNTPEQPGFWTSTRRPDNWALYTDFSDGRTHPISDDMGLSVRCVHDPLSAEESMSEEEVKAEIEAANHCEADADCVNVGSECPFGCAVVVNASEAARIGALLDAHAPTCVYRCMPVSQLVCEAGRCKAKFGHR